jgi:hypothetical protein
MMAKWLVGKYVWFLDIDRISSAPTRIILTFGKNDFMRYFPTNFRTLTAQPSSILAIRNKRCSLFRTSLSFQASGNLSPEFFGSIVTMANSDDPAWDFAQTTFKSIISL